MGVTWMKTGDESKKMAQQAEQEAEKRRAEIGKMFRFFMKPKEERKIIFVDGALDAQGFLNPPRFYEHNLYLNGSWGNTFVCPEKTDPVNGGKCPICEGGDRPQLVALFTIIDVNPYTAKNGKVYSNQRKLFVATPGTFEILNKSAIKRGGLVGATFDVSRTKDKDPRVGNVFDFMEKTDPEILKKKLMRTYTDKENKSVTVCDFMPGEYDKEIIYRTADELRKMGFGQPNHEGAKPPEAAGEAASEGEYAGNL
jgi:hypothetical protein